MDFKDEKVEEDKEPQYDWEGPVTVSGRALGLMDKQIGIRIGRLERYRISMGRTIPDPNKFAVAVKTLRKIAGNLQKHQGVQKYRELNLENKVLNDRLFKYADCMQFLHSLGFQKQGKKLIMEDENAAATAMAIETLAKAVYTPKEKPIERLPRKPKIYDQTLLNRAMRERSSLPDSTIVIDDEEVLDGRKNANLLKSGASDLSRKRAKVAPRDFMSVKMREERYGLKKAQDNFDKTVIRVNFSTKWTLQCCFNAKENVSELRSLVETLITPKNAVFSFALPPNMPLRETNTTFLKEGLKNATVRIKSRTPAFGLSEDAIRQYKTDIVEKPKVQEVKIDIAKPKPKPKRKVNKGRFGKGLLRGMK